MKIGEYEVIKEIGRGSTSTCYLAIKPPLERKVILKVLQPALAKDKEVCSRFIREAKILSRLNHPNIVNIIDFGKFNDTYFITTEYIEGDTLDKFLGKLEKEKIINIMYKLLSALDYCGAHNIIHRDIKPTNIIIDNEGNPKITDFGLAYIEGLSVLTQEGTFLGTPSYMAIEQLKGEKLDARADIYSLGIVMLELITGERAYFGKNYGEIIQKILNEEPKGIEKLNQPIANIVKKMIEKDKEKRYKNAKEVIKDLEKLKIIKYKIRRKQLVSFKNLAIIFLFFILALIGIFLYKPKVKESEVKTIQIIKNYKTERETIMVKSEEKTEKGYNQKAEKIANEHKTYTVLINATPYAKIYVDDSLLGETPPTFEVKFTEGDHIVSFINPALPKIVKKLSVKSDSKININLFEEFGYLFISVEPWGEIFIDGEYKSTTPIKEHLILLPGEHKIRIHNPYYRDEIRTINIEKKDTLNIKIKLMR